MPHAASGNYNLSSGEFNDSLNVSKNSLSKDLESITVVSLKRLGALGTPIKFLETLIQPSETI